MSSWSTTLSPAGPMRHVEPGWWTVVSVRLMCSSHCSSDETSGPGNTSRARYDLKLSCANIVRAIFKPRSKVRKSTSSLPSFGSMSGSASGSGPDRLTRPVLLRIETHADDRKTVAERNRERPRVPPRGLEHELQIRSVGVRQRPDIGIRLEKVARERTSARREVPKALRDVARQRLPRVTVRRGVVRLHRDRRRRMIPEVPSDGRQMMHRRDAPGLQIPLVADT